MSSSVFYSNQNPKNDNIKWDKNNILFFSSEIDGYLLQKYDDAISETELIIEDLNDDQNFQEFDFNSQVIMPSFIFRRHLSVQDDNFNELHDNCKEYLVKF